MQICYITHAQHCPTGLLTLYSDMELGNDFLLDGIQSGPQPIFDLTSVRSCERHPGAIPRVLALHSSCPMNCWTTDNIYQSNVGPTSRISNWANIQWHNFMRHTDQLQRNLNGKTCMKNFTHVHSNWNAVTNFKWQVVVLQQDNS